jgi:sarcosine oxidase
MIRQAYGEGADYVPLVLRAYELWRDLERRSGRRLLTVTGGLFAGTPGSWLVDGAQRSAERHGLPFERLSAREVNGRFPAFDLDDSLAAVHEPNAGFLDPEACIAAALEVAEAAGATARWREPVRAWRAGTGGVRVETEQGTYAAQRLVLTAGAWSPELLADLALPLVVWRVYNLFLEPLDASPTSPAELPCFFLDVEEGEYYGFPALPGDGVKVGRHDTGIVTTAAAAPRAVDDAEIEAVRRPVVRYLPAAGGQVLRTSTCLYTMTPDRDFVVDRHPVHPEVVYACGFSGHGFKFASALGEALAELVTGRQVTSPIGFLSARRLS